MFENPRRRRRSRSGRFVKTRSTRRRRSSRRRRRRNPGALATYGLRHAVLGNPRRRRRGRGKRRIFAIQRYFRQLQDRIPDVGWGLEGFFVTAAAPQYIGRFFPMVSKEGNQIIYYATKSAVALANGRMIEQFMSRRAGDAAVFGGLLTVFAEVVKDWVFPMVGLSAYLDGMGAYLDDGGLGTVPGAGETVPPELSAGYGTMADVYQRQEVAG